MRLVHLPEGKATCPCDDAALCETPTVRHEHEFFGFSAGNWSTFDWDIVTTVAWGQDPELVCRAHLSGARVVAAAPLLVFSPDPAVRKAWIDKLVPSLRSQFLDGVTFDFESPLDKSPGSPTAELQRDYVALVRETTAALHAALPGSQTSVCTAWSPADIDGRNYDYKALADASDLLYIMGYDTRSQIYGRCIASANAPLSLAAYGTRLYLELGIPADKLIMGTPWYGYQYPCLNAGPEDDFCQLKFTPFRGVNCSDAAGSEIAFMHIMDLFDRNICPPNMGSVCKVTTGLRWDASTSSPYFNFVTEDGQLHQLWFDNAESSVLKYELGRTLGVRGVGPFGWEMVDATGAITGNPKAPAEAKSMWQALLAFTGGHPERDVSLLT